MADKQALVDSGATDNFMHPNFAKRMGLGMRELSTPKKIFNIDNTTNKSGMITHYLNLNVVTKGILLRFAKCCPTWTRIMWMQPLMTQLWSLDTRYSNTRSPLYVRRHNSTSTKIDK
jgi:hypothetical protein